MNGFFKILKILGIVILILMAGLAGYVFLAVNDSPSITHDYGQWDNNGVKHILSNFDHRQILMKISLEEGQKEAPSLIINDTMITAKQNDREGRFWQFHYQQLQTDTTYHVQIKLNKEASTSTWPIHTFPHPDSTATELNVLAYTCAGGVEEELFGKEIFISIEARQEFLKKALTLEPDMVIANGDHVYWDQLSMQNSTSKRILKFIRDLKYGSLDLDKSVLDPANYNNFINIIDAQIADLYGCYLRSQSVYFVTDDHDLFENDEAHPDLVTFPPKEYMLDAALTTQRLYYPEFFNPTSISSGQIKGSVGLSASFGSVRYGDLAEFSLYDCKRYSNIDSLSGTLLPKDAEDWVIDRISHSSANWLIQVPSSPFGWTAGKWSEWYPDVLDEDGNLTIEQSKYLWPIGWWEQHQRILYAMHESTNTSIIIQGDLHMAGYGQLKKSGSISFDDQPVHLIAGPPLGSGTLAFPSSFRGTGSKVPLALEVDEIFPPVEKNGWTFLKISSDRINGKMYTWRPPQKVKEISDLKPSFEFDIIR